MSLPSDGPSWEDDDFELNLPPVTTLVPIANPPQTVTNNAPTTNNNPPPNPQQGAPVQVTAQQVTPLMRARTEAPALVSDLNWNGGTITLKKLGFDKKRMKSLLSDKKFRDTTVVYAPAGDKSLFPHVIVEYNSVGAFDKAHLTAVDSGVGRGGNGRIWYFSPQPRLNADPTEFSQRKLDGMQSDFRLFSDFLLDGFNINIGPGQCFYKAYLGDQSRRAFS